MVSAAVASGASDASPATSGDSYLSQEKTFQAVGLTQELAAALSRCGFTHPTTVQVFEELVFVTQQPYFITQIRVTDWTALRDKVGTRLM